MSKTLTLAALAIAASATFAAAESYIPFSAEVQDRDGVVELGTVRSAADGVVEVYAFHGGEIGDLLGSEAVNAGADANVRVKLGSSPTTDAIALLKIDGQTVDSQEIDFR